MSKKIECNDLHLNNKKVRSLTVSGVTGVFPGREVRRIAAEHGAPAGVKVRLLSECPDTWIAVWDLTDPQ